MKIICVSQNYCHDLHDRQADRPKEPVLFLKPDSALVLTQHPFVIPEFSENIHHEIELIVKISKVGKYIAPKFAHKYYDQISVGIDFTAVDLLSQNKAAGLPWEIAKAFDGSAVVGNFLPVTQFKPSENITFVLKNNSKVVQNGSSGDMFWTIDEIVSYASTFFTLKIGDIIFTGTPQGASTVKPNDFLEGFLNQNKLLSIQIK